MYTPYPPAREADLLTWSSAFKTKITATPTAYGLTAAQATAYGTLHDAFAAAYATANDQLTRSPASVATKNLAKWALVAQIRLLGGIVQRFPSTVAAGATVWLTAFWFNPRKESGIACDPISANLPGAVSIAARGGRAEG